MREFLPVISGSLNDMPIAGEACSGRGAMVAALKGNAVTSCPQYTQLEAHTPLSVGQYTGLRHGQYQCTAVCANDLLYVTRRSEFLF